MTDTDTYADLIAAEDVLLFVHAAITATGQREFHSEAYQQQLSLDFLHEYARVNYRKVYAASLALDINDHNAARIVQGLLETAAEATAEERRTEGRLIAARLSRLPPQRVYRLFRALRSAKVNNRRTRAIMRDWLKSRPDLAHDAVKYRSGLRTVARHAHLPLGNPDSEAPHELGDFLFRPGRLPRYRHRLLDAWRRAHYEQGAVDELPFTVAEGFAAKHGMKREAFLERMVPRMTRLERLRTQSTEPDGAGTGRQSAAYGTQLGTGGNGDPSADARPPVTAPLPRHRHRHRRMAKRQPGDRLRFLPLHLALEGYLSLHFGGPAIAWEEWSRQALRDGLSPRAEDAYMGWSVRVSATRCVSSRSIPASAG